MTPNQMRNDIRTVLRYSSMMSGSCTASYMGCMARYALAEILSGNPRAGDSGPEKYIDTANSSQLEAGWKYVQGWLPLAKRYLNWRARQGDGTDE